MSDLSSPPPHLAADAAGRPAGAASTAFVWPAPPDPAYAAAPRGGEPEPCEIEGPNGKVTSGLLAFFDPHAGVAHVKVPQARGIITLRLSQFRRMTLTRPVLPLPAPAADDPAAALSRTGLSNCRIRYRDGSEIDFDSIGHVDEVPGLFTFAPIDDAGAVLRSFFPRASCSELSVGPRLGEVLVDFAATTPAALDEAIAEQQTLRSRKLGDVLLAQETVTPEQLEAAHRAAGAHADGAHRRGADGAGLHHRRAARGRAAAAEQRPQRAAGRVAGRARHVTRGDLQSALARKMGYPVVDVGALPGRDRRRLRVPYPLATPAALALPLLLRGGRLIVAHGGPVGRVLIDELEFTAQCKIVPVLARAGTLIERSSAPTSGSAQDALASARREPSPGSRSTSRATTPASCWPASSSRSARTGRDNETPIEQSDNSLVRLINTMILEAHQQGVSDIHIECQPGREKVRIRFRQDGVLRPTWSCRTPTARRWWRASRSCATSTSPSAASRRTARSTSAASSQRPAGSSCAWPPSPPTTAWRTW